MAIDTSLPKDKRILLAAEQVFSGRGYEKATVDEIIALADVGKGTVYKYFGNKEQLFYKLVSDKNEPFVKQLRQAVDSAAGLEAKLLSYMAEMIDFYRKNQGLWQIICFEMLGVSNGCRVARKDGKVQVLSRYSNLEPSEATIAQVLRYYEIMESEFIILFNLIDEGMKNGILKKGDSNIATRELFWSVAMCVFNPTDYDSRINSKEAAEIVIDRFLYGSMINEKR